MGADRFQCARNEGAQSADLTIFPFSNYDF